MSLPQPAAAVPEVRSRRARATALALGLASLAALVPGAGTARAAGPEPAAAAAASPPAGDAERHAANEARRLLAAGSHEQARTRLKAELEVFPDSRPLRMLLGAAYIDGNNPFWAVRTLAPLIEAAPSDCEARLWLGWAHFNASNLDLALETIDHASCRGPGPLATRATVLRAMVAYARGRTTTARAELDRARARETAFDSDREAIALLTRQIDPDRLPELALQVDLRGGHTTNPLLGSPVDPTAPATSTASSFVQASAWARYAPELGGIVRPSLELQARIFRLLDHEVVAQSYFNPTGRAGAYVGERVPRLLVAYRPDYLELNGGDVYGAGPLWYVGAHRGELELEITPSLLFFAGAGRRDFRVVARNRFEADGGLGGQWSLTDGLSLVWAGSGRKHWTAPHAYDLVGATAIGSLQYLFGPGWQARAGLTLAADWYPRSAGYFADDQRRDLFFKASGAFWSPAWQGLRTGLGYDYSNRDSTASAYSFVDHRFTMLLAWSGDTGLGGPSGAPTPALADIDWGLGKGQASSAQRIQELLRQDEQTLQRSCGCRE